MPNSRESVTHLLHIRLRYLRGASDSIVYHPVNLILFIILIKLLLFSDKDSGDEEYRSAEFAAATSFAVETRRYPGNEYK